MRMRALWISTLTSVLILSSATSARAEWLIESENKSSGLTTNASTFWAQRHGPLSFDEIMSIGGKDGDYFAILTITCSSKQLAISVSLSQFGSGHEEIRVDDPGFVDFIFNSQVKKRFRTRGEDYPANVSFTSTEARKLIKEALKRKSMSAVIRNNSTKERIPVLFDVTGLSKASSRFRFAGCKI